MIKRWASLLGLLCCIWLVPVLAQSSNVVVDDPDGLFGDGTAVKSAAQKLAGEGVDVVVVGIRDAGTSTTAADASLDTRLRALGLADSSKNLRGSQIVFFVAPTPGYNAIYFVSKYKDKLQSSYKQIQTNDMQPLLTKGDYSGGMVAGINAVRTTLNPPTSPVVWVVLGVVVVGILAAVGIPLLRRQQQAAQTTATARDAFTQARQAAANDIASLGQRMKDAKDQAPYDKVTYGDAAAQRIAAAQSKSERTFADAQAAFDAAEEAQSNAGRTPADYKKVGEQYAEAQRLARQAAEELSAVDQLRASLDKKDGPQTGPTERLQ